MVVQKEGADKASAVGQKAVAVGMVSSVGREDVVVDKAFEVDP